MALKDPLSNPGDIRDADSVPGSRRSPGGGHSNPLQYSFLENPMDRGAWWATVNRVAQNRTYLAHMHALIQVIIGRTEISTQAF